VLETPTLKRLGNFEVLGKDKTFFSSPITPKEPAPYPDKCPPMQVCMADSATGVIEMSFVIQGENLTDEEKEKRGYDTEHYYVNFVNVQPAEEILAFLLESFEEKFNIDFGYAKRKAA
jgi:hypothetical protein